MHSSVATGMKSPGVACCGGEAKPACDTHQSQTTVWPLELAADGCSWVTNAITFATTASSTRTSQACRRAAGRDVRTDELTVEASVFCAGA